MNGYVPPLDPETGEPSRSDARYALNITAFVVAAGMVLFQFGSRAALVSALGLDFATENLELRDGLEAVLGYAPSIGPGGGARTVRAHVDGHEGPLPQRRGG